MTMKSLSTHINEKLNVKVSTQYDKAEVQQILDDLYEHLPSGSSIDELPPKTWQIHLPDVASNTTMPYFIITASKTGVTIVFENNATTTNMASEEFMMFKGNAETFIENNVAKNIGDALESVLSSMKKSKTIQDQIKKLDDDLQTINKSAWDDVRKTAAKTKTYKAYK